MNGDTQALQTIDDVFALLPERFWDKVYFEPNTGCWLWTAGRDRRGYGHYAVKATRPPEFMRAHRVAYLTLVGDIPDGCELDHLCRTPSCVNPSHLEPVPHVINVRRGLAGENMRSRTHCPRGHPLAEPNLYHRHRGRLEHRICLTCKREQDAHRQREARARGTA